MQSRQKRSATPNTRSLHVSAVPVPSPTLVERDAAAYIGTSVAFLRKLRQEGRGPDYVKLGRSVRYLIHALDAFLAAHTVSPKADAGAGANPKRRPV